MWKQGKEVAELRGKNLGTDLTTGNITGRLLRFSLPLFMANFLQIAYNMVDTIVIGQYVGSAGLSGVSVGGDITNLCSFIAMGFTNAGQIVISQYIGAKKQEMVSKVIGTLFTFCFCASIFLSIICLVFKDVFLSAMNTPEEAYGYANLYVTVCMYGLVFSFGYNAVAAMLRGMGDSKHPFMFVAIATVINLVLDLVFVGALKWDAFGVALATVIGQAVSFICAIVLLYKRRGEFGFDFKPRSFGINKTVFMPMLKLGIPMSLQSCAIQFSKVFVNSWINSYGVTVSAVSSIGNKLNQIANTIDNSTATASAAMIGQCIGAEKYERVPKVIRTSFVINMCYTMLLIFAVVIFPNQVFGLFTGEKGVLDVCIEYIPVACLVFISGAVRSPMNGLINGSGNSKLNLLVAVFDGVVARIGLAILFGLVFKWGYMGFWYGNAFAGFVPFIIGGIYLLTGKWKTRKHVICD